MSANASVCELPAPITLGQFREFTKHMPDDLLIAPRFVPGHEPSDLEPGVRLLGIGRGDGVNETPVISLAVELFYLDEEAGDNNDDV